MVNLCITTFTDQGFWVAQKLLTGQINSNNICYCHRPGLFSPQSPFTPFFQLLIDTCFHSPILPLAVTFYFYGSLLFPLTLILYRSIQKIVCMNDFSTALGAAALNQHMTSFRLSNKRQAICKSFHYSYFILYKILLML